jgi:hypothetical protein
MQQTLQRTRSARPLRAAVSILLAALAPAHAFDDKQFCISAEQLAKAAEKDIGIWIDRVTRNAGMVVVCPNKVVEFTRFSYIGSASLTADWRAAKSSEWNTAQCTSMVWKEAINSGWSIVLSITTADGGRATFKAQCR